MARKLLHLVAALYLFAAVAAQSGLPTKWGTCLVPNVKQNFNLSLFFSDHWYKQKGFGSLFYDLAGVCPTVEYKVENNGEILSLDYAYNPFLQRYLTKRGICELTYSQQDIGYFHFTYYLAQGLITTEFPMYIIDTDYEDWAVVYYCQPLLFFMKTEAAWVMSRSRNGTVASEDTIMNIINSSGMDYNDFSSETNTGCGLDEPSL